MDTSYGLFIVEGLTDIPLVRSCLVRCFSGTEASPLRVTVPEWQGGDTFPRSKYLLRGDQVGIFCAGSRAQAMKILELIVRLHIGQHIFPELRFIVFVRDINGSAPRDLHRGFIGRISELARELNIQPVVIQDDPAVAGIGQLSVAQVLFGDPGFGNFAMHRVEDHMLKFLQEQPTRDPTQIAKIVEQQINVRLTQKQLIHLAIARVGYWGGEAGFYERVIGDVPDTSLLTFSDTVGLTSVLKVLMRADDPDI